MKKIIVLVEDDESLSEGLILLLSQEGYHVEHFSDSLELKKYVTHKIPHLFILDYRLPGEDGISITNYLRNRNTTRNIPIILMSATQPGIMEPLMKNKINAYFPKPFEMDEFLKAVDTFTK